MSIDNNDADDDDHRDPGRIDNNDADDDDHRDPGRPLETHPKTWQAARVSAATMITSARAVDPCSGIWSDVI